MANAAAGPLVFSNNALTNTTSTYGTTSPASGTQESWVVSSAASFPVVSSAAGTYFHIVDPAQVSEMVKVINTAGTTWAVIRGDEGTTPVAHATGAMFRGTVTAGDFGSFEQGAWGMRYVAGLNRIGN